MVWWHSLQKGQLLRRSVVCSRLNWSSLKRCLGRNEHLPHIGSTLFFFVFAGHLLLAYELCSQTILQSLGGADVGVTLFLYPLHGTICTACLNHLQRVPKRPLHGTTFSVCLNKRNNFSFIHIKFDGGCIRIPRHYVVVFFKPTVQITALVLDTESLCGFREMFHKLVGYP